ncbi:PEP/pyruvate-binding domain-containing protein [Sinomonas sp. ASV322]|uniref:PEP/pyruvate-binding domain-containing protein n=1 Tax=Sinomonas sp. ASV322 TaxID=3041920 RepID=UPI0027DCFD65|nr:PEP/pyruvate-binding domain-containing protein [Sinomonas sp. ASV322]MDQ4500708.1 PEP/pyruvate-binding domain-containing protein [Sinomonas sp. ASV322]
MESDSGRLIVDLRDPSSGSVALAGGKAANLGELTRAGFPVPDGFVLTTEAYRIAALQADANPDSPASAAAKLRAAAVPRIIADAVLDAYHALGSGPVAIRSSATAEDLPDASFAGQHDTYLGVVGDEPVLDAVRQCWASLWNDRAVAYRRANAIDGRDVALAVVLQKMVDASAAGVLFTADPVIGTRRRAAVDAAAGLGEALVSGDIVPDHYLVDTVAQAVLRREPAEGAAAVLSDTELVELALLGDRVERFFGSPQDIEFALDAERALWLVQSRNITTLYPVPEGAPDPTRDLRVYLSANVVQGYFEPITPMGMQFFRLLGSGMSKAFGGRVQDPAAGPRMIADAAMRFHIDVTTALRDPVGHRLLKLVARVAESRSSVVLSQLSKDPRFSIREGSRFASIRRIAEPLARLRVPLAVLHTLVSPDSARLRLARDLEAISPPHAPADGDATGFLDAVERLLMEAPPRMFPRFVGTVAPAMLSLGLAGRVLRGRASADDIRTVTRGAPENPTTEMDLALWSVGAAAREDAASKQALLERSPAELAEAYRTDSLPDTLQTQLADFLSRYGFRCISEIDIGTPRWSEDPTHLLGAIANYVRLGDEVPDPGTQFAASALEAEAMVENLLHRVRGPRRMVLRFALRRVRVLIGTREAPKFHLIRLVATPARELLKPVGEQLAARGRIADPSDVFFLTFPEARRAVDGDDLAGIVTERRAAFERERKRKHIPRVLLSDGSDAEAMFGVRAGKELSGTPASPGVVTGPARVILSPEGARLEPGEILVAPSTNPGWTPLFLTAGGLVMEMGGAMSHGAVVAREFGIPATVGVVGATERIRTGTVVTVDGSQGTVSLEEGAPPAE